MDDKPIDIYTQYAHPWDRWSETVEYVADEIAKNRLSICEGCPFYDVVNNNTCTECGCEMPEKVKILNAQCPVGHW